MNSLDRFGPFIFTANLSVKGTLGNESARLRGDQAPGLSFFISSCKGRNGPS